MHAEVFNFWQRASCVYFRLLLARGCWGVEVITYSHQLGNKMDGHEDKQDSDYINEAKLCEQAERFEDMAKVSQFKSVNTV